MNPQCNECADRDRCHPLDETLEESARTIRFCNFARGKIKNEPMSEM